MRGTILVVDDDGEMRAIIRAFLEGEGYRVLEASSGDQAMVILETERLDVAILDKEMEGMSGLDLLSYLRHRCPEVRVILITAFGGRQVAEEAQRRGAHSYVEKPFRVARILQEVEGMTRGRQPSSSS
ncbi:MAG: response regulator [Candidatus Rokuibacteriota bacterium]